jgi:hypothetical protein
MVVDNQRTFFAQIEEINRQTDHTLTTLIQEEIKKMNELVSINSKVIDKKIAKLYNDLDMEKLLKLVDRKMNRDEAEERFLDALNKYFNAEKGIVKVYNQVE